MFDSILRVTGGKESDWKIEYQDAKERWQQGFDWLVAGGERFADGYIQKMYTRIFFKDGPRGCGDFSEMLDNERLGLPKEDLDEATKRSLQMVADGYNYFTRFESKAW